MNTSNVFKAFLFTVLLLSALPTRCETLIGQVIGVTDGDTLTLLVRNTEVKIRLQFIDAPEKRQAFGTKAKQALSDLAFNKRLNCERGGFDRYGRSLAVCYDGTVDVNKEMVGRGMAWVYRQYAKGKVPTYYEAEADAQQNKRGLWGDATPTPPWEWRRTHRPN